MKTKQELVGIYVASITAFDQAGNVDAAALQKLMQRNINEGAAGFFVGGSSGECFMLTEAERVQVFEAAAAYAGKTNLIAHVGAIGTAEAVRYAKAAMGMGYDVVAATAPFYYGFSPKEVCRYYYDIAEASGSPVLIYNFPGNTHREFDVANRTYIMGILNVTPDSFSDGGKWNSMDNALRHAEAMIAEGADILDVGGESTRPGHTPVSAEEEAARVLPVIEALNSHFDVPISVDTFKASVAEVSLQAGADLVNDVWGLKYDPQMASVIAKYNAACCLMHNKEKAEYNNFLVDMLAETQECVNIARRAGISDEKIILDPGIGFGKTYEMNLEAMNHLELFQHLGFPVLLGTSRKSMIGLALDLPVDQRVEGTIATSVIGVMKGCAFVRVHDVKENKRAVQMTEAILGRHME